MAQTFGLDFGTTNTVASYVAPRHFGGDTQVIVLTNTEDVRPHPSVVWYRGDHVVVGRAAKAALGELGLGVIGDFVRSPKMLLGAPHPISVGGVKRHPVDISSEVLHFIRQDALNRGHEGQTFERAVMTIPVSMRGKARQDLRDAALKAGIQIHQFVHEPLAALYGYLRSNPDGLETSSLEGRLAIVFDWGGGTLDLTLCKIANGMLTQIANLGDPHVGGDQFDLALFNLVRTRHQEQHPSADWTRLQPSARARLLQACEDAKITLSNRDSTTIFMLDVLATQGPESVVEVEVTREDLRNVTEHLVRQGLSRIEQLLSRAGVAQAALEFCLATGGMVQMPTLRMGLMEIFGASVCRVVKNASTIISEGAAWIAHDNVPVQLAKGLCLLHAGDSYTPVIRELAPLPTGEQGPIAERFDLFCVDPRDGFAKFLFARPKWPGDESQMLPYGQVAVHVDPMAEPLLERLQLNVSIDRDMIARVVARSELRGDERAMEIYDLEFGLGIGHV